MKANLSSIRFNSTQIELTDHALIEVSGADREAFFQGQVTNDLQSLGLQEAQVTARLNRTGKLQSFFTIARLEDKLLILCEKSLVENILTDFIFEIFYNFPFLFLLTMVLKHVLMVINQLIFLAYNYYAHHEDIHFEMRLVEHLFFQPNNY